MHKKGARLPAVTLIEVLIVTTVLAVLIVATLFYVRSSMPKARDGERKADLKKISVAMEQYRSDYGGYPHGMVPNTSSPAMPTQVSACGTNTVLAPYLADVPCDPDTQQPYRYNPRGTFFTGKRNVRVYPQYRMLTHLEYEADPIIQELCPQTPPPHHCGGTVLPFTVGTAQSVNGITPRLNYGIAGGATVRQ